MPALSRHLAPSLASIALLTLSAQMVCAEGDEAFAIVAPIAPTKAVLFTEGGAIPGAGLPGTGVPADATWTGFGTPAINDAGDVSFLGRWISPSGRGTGVFISSPSSLAVQLRAKVGDTIPGIGRIVTFTDPQIAADGSLLFFTTVEGATVKPGTGSVLLWISNNGTLQRVVARSGMRVPSLSNATLTTMTAALGSGGKVGLRVNLAGDARTNDANNSALLVWSSSTGVLESQLREGETIPGIGKVARFVTLVNATDTPGSSQGWFFADSGGQTQFYARGIFSNGFTHLLSLEGPFKTSLASARLPAAGTQYPLRSIGLPSFRESGSPRSAFRAVGSNRKIGIYHLDPVTESSELVLAAGQSAPGVINRKALSFTDPICSPDGGGSLWTARVGRITTPEPGRVLYWAKTGGTPEVVAREGLPAADCEPGVNYRKFQAYTLPGGTTGPIFTATLSGPGLLPIEDRGLWAVDSSGVARLLLRESEVLGAKEVRSFQTLTPTAGAQGAGRSYNRHGQLVVLATHPDHSTSIAIITVP